MSYPSFEATAGDVIAQVQANSLYLTNAGTFDANTSPSITSVHVYATNAYGYVCGKLMAAGFGTAAATTIIQNILTTIQALDTSVQVEQSVPYNEKGEANLRYRTFEKRRDDMLNTFVTLRALEGLGAETASGGDLSAFVDLTGRSISRSNAVYADSDIWQPRFNRGFHDKKVGQGSGSGAADE